MAALLLSHVKTKILSEPKVSKSIYSCLYIPQRHHFIHTLWLWSTNECVFFLFWAKVHL